MMKNKKVIVLEANEIPLKLFRYYAERKPHSAIATLLEQAMVLATEASDVHPRSLYPSQSWASLNTGVPYDLHNIHWYHDPKPASYPFYWRLLADHGHRVGLVSTLHTSPAKQHIDSQNIKFLIPDCFAEDVQTKPNQFEVFQQINLKQTEANKRVASPLHIGMDELKFLMAFPRLGMRLSTLGSISFLLGEILLKRVNKERIRVLQFLFLKDIFLKAIRSYDVDLAVFFTNHVAASMHRYWYALFPDEYDSPLYDRVWIDQYKEEILYSLSLLDDFLGEMMNHCTKTDKTLILVTSMGQYANPFLKKADSNQFILESLKPLLKILEIPRDSCDILTDMVPEYSLRFHDINIAKKALIKFTECKSPGIKFDPELNGNVLTIDLWADPDRQDFEIDGACFTDKQLGLKKIPVLDSHTGRHHPLGSLFIYGGHGGEKKQAPVNYLEYAPALCEYFHVPLKDYMIRPTFQI